MTIRAPKDFWSGLMFVAFAAMALFSARFYSVGNVGKMGPGYFPQLLGWVLAFIGAILIGRSLVITGERVERLSLIPLTIIALAVCLFAAFIETLGLVVALVVVILVSALASRESRAIEATLLAVTLVIFAVGVFVYGLRLPLPVWPAF